MMSVKLTTLGNLKIKTIWNKSYDIIITASVITNKILSCKSYNIVYVLMWPKFGNSGISVREAIVTSIL